ncbi:MAG: tetratricopeptide repeat protein [Rhodothermales bacterium]
MTLLLALALLLPAQAESPDEAEALFALGNRLYEESDFQGAAAAYEGALDTGWTDPALELRLGNAYFEAGQLGRAVLHFERAHRLAPRNEAVQHNLRLARERVPSAEPSPLAPAEAAARWLAMRVGSDGMAALLFALYLGVLGLVGFQLWTKTENPWRRRALLVLVPLGLLVAVAAVATARYEAQPRAVVVADAAALRTTPSSTGAVAATVPEGSVLTLAAERGAWRGVRLPDGTTAWAGASALEEI